MSNYTNGPWKLDVTPNGCPIKEILAADGRGVCEIYEGDSPDKVWANSYLIAASPQLLEALSMAFARLMEIEISNDISIPHELREASRAAIAKATGEAA